MSLPIIMLTAEGDDVDRILGLEMGADDCLAEPFDRAIDVRVSRLRRKLETAGEVIETVRGTGYFFVPDVERT